MSRSFRAVLGCYSVFVAFWLVAPTLIVVPISFSDRQSLSFPPKGWSLQWYANFFQSAPWFDAFVDSIQIACIVAIVATALGTMAAVSIHKVRHPIAGFVRSLLIMPMIVPGVVLALGIYAVFLRIGLVGTFIGYVLAHTLLAVPLVLISVGASLSVYDDRLELAAASLGASRLNAFRTVTFPLIAPGIFSGLVFAFITSFDEVIVALFITSPRLTTLPVRIYLSLTRDADPTVAAVGTITFVGTTVFISVGMLLASGRKGKRI